MAVSATSESSLRERKKTRARRDILRCARVLIDLSGYQQAKMRDIATAADVSYQTLYNYFPTKASILEAILTADIEDVAAEIASRIDSYQGGLLSTLSDINRIRLQIIAADGKRDLWRIVVTELSQQGAAGSHILAIIDRAAEQMISRLLHRSHGSGELAASLNIQLLASTLYSLAQYALSRFLLEPERDPIDTLTELDAQMSLLLTPYLIRQLR